MSKDTAAETESNAKIAEWRRRFNYISDDLGCALRQHEDTKRELAEARAVGTPAWEKIISDLNAIVAKLPTAHLADIAREGYNQDALDVASREVHMMLLREGSSWGIKACEEMGRVFMTAYRKAAKPTP